MKVPTEVTWKVATSSSTSRPAGGGQVEPIIRPGNEPDPAKFMDLNMLVMLGGRERTADDFGRLYAEAGFRLTDVIRTGSSFHIVEGAPV